MENMNLSVLGKPVASLLGMLTLLFVTSCSRQGIQLTNQDVIGVWKLQTSSFQSPDYSLRDFLLFQMVVNNDGTFSAHNIPTGIFFNESSNLANFSGTWSLRHEDGYAYLDLFFTNIPGYQGGMWGSSFDWEDGERVLRLGGNDFIYISRFTGNESKRS